MINRFKTKIIAGLLSRTKAFNEKHRGMARFATGFTLFLIILISIIFIIPEMFTAGEPGKMTVGKRVLGAIVAVALVVVIVKTHVWAPGDASEVKSDSQEIIDTMTVDDISAGTGNTSETEVQVISGETSEAEEQVVPEEETSSEEETTSNTEASINDSDDVSALATTNQSPTKEWDTCDVDLAPMMEQYPETVGWIYFEDGHISYPIMQGDDNEKYRWVGFNGFDSETGAIFLDSRSASDFSDPNSIVYGHNMKNRSMFGTLRDYREDPQYYNGHEYFQIITPNRKYRYLIFCYMDVPNNYVIYDYVSDASLEFVKDAEAVRRKSYMDSEFPVNADSNVVTLSTCSDQDDLRFVILGVKVDETEY